MTELYCGHCGYHITDFGYEVDGKILCKNCVDGYYNYSKSYKSEGVVSGITFYNPIPSYKGIANIQPPKP